MNDIALSFSFIIPFQNLTALKNVELALRSAKTLDAERVLIDVGLGNGFNNFPAQLSGGAAAVSSQRYEES